MSRDIYRRASAEPGRTDGRRSSTRRDVGSRDSTGARNGGIAPCANEEKQGRAKLYIE